MILRKPYAFFIKNFRLIHVILAIMIFYTLYMNKLLLDFFNEYAATIINVIGQDLSSTLLPFSFQIMPIFIIILSGLVLFIMIAKTKPTLFYILNMLIYIYCLIIFQVARSTLNTMSLSLIEARTVMLIRDLITVAFILQIIPAVFVTIRATGFDVKKFHFKEDLKELEVSEEDREEVEVDISFDKNKFIRNINKTTRFLKYAYKENRLAANIFGVLLIIGISFVIYFNISNRTVILEQNVMFSGNRFNMTLEKSYLTNTDFEGRLIDSDYYYLALKVKLRNNSSEVSGLDIATTKVVIGNYIYTPTTENKDSFFDLGDVYKGENIKSEYETKILLYKIPKELIKKDMIFSFVDKNNLTKDRQFKTTLVKIKYNNLTGIATKKTASLNETLELSDSILPSYKININSIDIQDQYKLEYDFCLSNECYKSYEYLKPSIESNYNKILLKVVGTLDNEQYISGVSNLYDFINNFGKLYYKVDDVEKVQKIKFKEVKSSKKNEKDTYYIEVLDEVKNASNVSIMFTVRNINYEYVLK